MVIDVTESGMTETMVVKERTTVITRMTMNKMAEGGTGKNDEWKNQPISSCYGDCLSISQKRT